MRFTPGAVAGTSEQGRSAANAGPAAPGTVPDAAARARPAPLAARHAARGTRHAARGTRHTIGRLAGGGPGLAPPAAGDRTLPAGT
ncbi:hypothetical protein AB0G63_28270, partial [Streptomyces sp. NPDC020996]